MVPTFLVRIPLAAFKRHVVFCWVALSLAPLVRADIYELKDGGQVAGKTVERTKEGDFIVRTPEGALVTLDRQLLQRVVTENDVAAEYRQRSRSSPDTIEAHRQLAEWCRQHKLTSEAQVHLARIAELDPSDAPALQSLGYQRVGNRWLTGDQLMIQRGLKQYEGKYRTPQDIAIRERNKQQDAANVDWFQQLRIWRGWLDNRRSERVAQAQAQIAAISDPEAAPAIIKLLDDERDREVFELLLRTLGTLDHPAAIRTLVEYTLDPAIAPEIRDQCLDYLVREDRVVPLVPYVQALKDKDNRVVRRAGYALGKIADPAAISPLIDALVTKHKMVLQPESSGGSPIGASFDPSGGSGGGFSMGGNGPKVIYVDKQNPQVLQALVKLSGAQPFEYDERAWRAWFVDLQMRQRINARRDE